MKLIIIPFLLIFGKVFSCVIAGKQHGICIQNPLSDDSFCSSEIQSYVCVPAHNVTWSSYNGTYKDKLIEQIFMNYFQQQLIDEYLNGNSSLLIANNPSCYNAYKQFICQWNFPKCTQENISVPICASVCNNFYSNCGANADACSILFNSIDSGLDQNC